MYIERTQFGSITIDGHDYNYDIVICANGTITKRKKKLSKEKYGTSHIVSEEEAKYLYEEGCTMLILGTGQFGRLELSSEAHNFFAQHHYTVIAQPTPQAIDYFNREKATKIAMFHLTC